MDESEKKCRVTQVKNVLNKNGFRCVWLQQGVGDEKILLCELKRRLTDNLIHEWNATIRDKDGYFPYRNVKSIFQPLKYIASELECANCDLVCYQLTTIFIATVLVRSREIV